MNDTISNSKEKLSWQLRPNTKDVTKTENCKFTDFFLSTELLRGIHASGFLYPSPIQKEVIPEILMGKHVLARAKNGTGKTAAFAIPSIQLVDTRIKRPQVIVLVPSRELALQTNDVFAKLCSELDVRTLLAIGGTSVEDNFNQLMGTDSAQIVVGTPGRVLHIFEKYPQMALFVKIVTIDEADVLLSSRFLQVIEQILLLIPCETRRILLFSATFPRSVQEFSNAYMPQAALVSTMERLTLRGVTPYYVFLDESEKLKCLWFLINRLTVNQCIVFVNSVFRAELLLEHMRAKGYSVACIHSKMAQEQRNAIYADFKKGQFRHLVATNLFTRGIDVKTVNVVVNFDFPSTVETYLHRIGRSGRFGQVGLSIELVTSNDKENFYKIEDYLGIDIEALPEHVDEALYN